MSSPLMLLSASSNEQLNQCDFQPFFPWKILCIDRNHIFHVKCLRKFANKKSTDIDIKRERRNLNVQVQKNGVSRRVSSRVFREDKFVKESRECFGKVRKIQIFNMKPNYFLTYNLNGKKRGTEISAKC
jgi:hypothetical protein